MDEDDFTRRQRALRERLAQRRADLGLSARQVGDRIAEDLHLDVLTPQSIYQWERFARHPSLDKLDAWARAVGLELVVDLQEQGGDAALSPEVAAAAHRLQRAAEHERRLILGMISTLPDDLSPQG